MSAEPVNNDIPELVSAAVKVAAAGELDRYLRWNLLNLLHELTEDDYTRDELMAMNAINAQALSRKLSLAHPGGVFAGPGVFAGVPAEVSGQGRLRVVPESVN